MSRSAVGFEAFDPPKTKAPEEPSVRKQADKAGYVEFEKSSDNCYFEDEEGKHHPFDVLSEQNRRPLQHIDSYCNLECSCLSKRYTIALLACVGFIITFGMRCNVIMARLQSTNDGNMTLLNWWATTQRTSDSSFFWGYLIAQLVGGILASFFPANRIFGVGIFISSFLNLLVPIVIGYRSDIYIIVQLCKGLAEGVMFPACHGIWNFWAPPLERTRLATLAFCGSYAAILIGMPLSGVLTTSLGWRASFYFYGICGIIWFGFWQLLSYEKPSKHPHISASELQYIKDSLGKVQVSTFSSTPWSKFFTSMPVYAIVVANFCRSWNFYLLVLYQAQFMYEAFGMPTFETGFLGWLPHVLMTFIVPFGGLLADHLRKSGRMSTTNVRKVFSCGGFGTEALLFLVVALCAHTKYSTGATLALLITVICRGFAISGYNVNHLDIAPRYASILMGMSGCIGTIAGLVVPIVVEYINESEDGNSWRNVFIVAAFVHLVGASFYGVFCSGEPQPWAEGKKRWNTVDDSNDKHEAVRIFGAGGRANDGAIEIKNVHI